MTKTILITGASSGFGRDTAETLAKAGHKVFAGVRDTTGRNRTIAIELRATGIESVELDVTRDAGVDAALRQLLAKSGGKLDVVINNAGIASAGVSESFTPEQVRELFEVNVFGVQRVLRAVFAHLWGVRDGKLASFNMYTDTALVQAAHCVPDSPVHLAGFPLRGSAFRPQAIVRRFAGALVVAMNHLNPSAKLSARTDNDGRVGFGVEVGGS